MIKTSGIGSYIVPNYDELFGFNIETYYISFECNKKINYNSTNTQRNVIYDPYFGEILQYLSLTCIVVYISI